MMTDVQTRARRRDRWVDWLVIGVFVVALLLGWVVKVVAEGRSVLYAAEGLRVRYPAGWVKMEGEAPLVAEFADPWAQPYRTTIRIERHPLPPKLDKPLDTVLQMLQLERGQAWQAYRVLQRQETTLGGRRGLELTFAYVEANPNPFLATLPVVMRGRDFVFIAGDRAYVVTLTAAQENYATAQRLWRALVRSLTVQ